MMVWHYTIRKHLASILQDGELRPAMAHVPKDERPMLWFSANQSFEPTARKGLAHVVNGKVHSRTMSVEETEEMGGGLVRFGIDASGAILGAGS